MEIKLYDSLSLHETGKREKQEDSIYPGKGDTANQAEGLFMVCDGVGGNEKGEVASKLAIDSFVDFVTNNPSDTYDKAYFTRALDETEKKFDEYIKANPSAKGMATTLTLVYFNKFGASLAHTGDSRIYHLRNNAILFNTRDHSYVNYLIDLGEITEEEAQTDPDRNMIMHAISGKNRPAIIDVYETKNIDPGDYFFLCSDGVLEAVSEENLLEILFDNIGNKDKLDRIKSLCEKQSEDNYSCYLLQVESIKPKEITNPIEEQVVEEQVVEEPKIEEQKVEEPKENPVKSNNKFYKYLLSILKKIS